MPGPTTSLSTFRPDIPGAMEEFSLEQNEAGYIGLQAARVLEVNSPAENVGKIPLKSLLIARDTQRNSSGHYSSDDWEFEKWSYSTVEHGFEGKIDDRLSRLYRSYFDMEMLTARRVRGIVGRNLESRIAALFAAATNTTAASTVWTDASATPLAKVEVARTAIIGRTGMKPNCLIVSDDVYRYLRFTTELIDRLKYNGVVDVVPGKITAAQMAAIFDVDYFLVAGARKNTANSGQTASLSTVWTKTEAYLCRVATSDDPHEPCFARTIHWGEDGSQIGGVVETYRDDSRRSDILRVRMETDEVTMYDAMCQRITGVAA